MRLQSASGMKDEARGNLLAGLKLAIYVYNVGMLAFVCHIHGVTLVDSQQPDNHYQNDRRSSHLLHTDIGRHI